MVQNSGPLVDGVVSALDACDTGDRAAFNSGMEKVVASMTKVNKVMDGESYPVLFCWSGYGDLCLRRLKLTRLRYVGKE